MRSPALLNWAAYLFAEWCPLCMSQFIWFCCQTYVRGTFRAKGVFGEDKRLGYIWLLLNNQVQQIREELVNNKVYFQRWFCVILYTLNSRWQDLRFAESLLV